MDAKDLRIGNYVEFLGEHKELLYLTKHNGKNETVIYYVGFKNHIPVMFSHLRPIPLTEEWLVKFGVGYIEQYYALNDLKLWQINKGKYMVGIHIDDYFHQLTGYDIEYVHQLQNLYHALTGKELTIKD